MAAEFSWTTYWQWQSRSWLRHDNVALFCKMTLLIGNVISKAYTEDDTQRILFVKGLAMICALGHLPTLWLLWSKPNAYLRYRRIILQVHWIATVIMVDISLPLHGATKLSNGVGVQHLLSFVFRLSGFTNITMSAMHRLPWQTAAALAGVYGVWVVLTWTQPFCSYLLNDPAAGSDNRQLLTSIATAIDFLTGHGEFVTLGNSSVWQPYAHMISTACMGRSSTTGSTVKPGQRVLQGDHCAAHYAYSSSVSSSNVSFPANSFLTSAAGTTLCTGREVCFAADTKACEVLLQGQCVAVTRTLMICLPVLTLIAVAILFERYNKWTYVHVHAPWALNQPGLPAIYTERNKHVFVTKQLLQLHALLDVPVFVLWMGFCSWSRPAAAVEKLLGIQA